MNNYELESKPIGTILNFQKGSKIPEGWVPADGQLMSKANFLELYKVVKEAYTGDKDPGDYFRIPDMRPKIFAVFTPFKNFADAIEKLATGELQKWIETTDKKLPELAKLEAQEPNVLRTNRQLIKAKNVPTR